MTLLPVVACAAAVTGTLARGAFSPNSRVFGRAIGHGSRNTRSIYLTFDDGPSPSATPGILSTLSGRNVPAAFFMIGAHAESFASIAREVAGAGHEIGNHTQRHRKLHLRGPRVVRAELEEAHARLVDITGRSPRTFRAPHGYRNPFVTAEARRLGYSVIGWSFGVWDTALPGAGEIRRRVRARLRPGSIVLLHDGDGYDARGDRSQTADALPGIIDDAMNAGFAIRPLSELLEG